MKYLKFPTSLMVCLCLGFMLLNQSCKKEIVQTPGTNILYNNNDKVMASLCGIIMDENGTPLQNANVMIENNAMMTDSNGYFNFNQIMMPSHNTIVRASKSTYFNGYSALTIKENNHHIIYLKLIKKENPQIYNASNGGIVNFPNGLSISFPTNAVINKQSGVAYNGQVYAYAKVIDASTASGMLSMPGDLRGISQTTGEEKILKNYGMFIAELMDQNGNVLQLATNQKATVSMAIPTSMIGSAEANFPLWYFDESKGIWIEEGLATKKGSNYVGDIAHFSIWNCSQPTDAINIEMNLVSQDGVPLQGYEVKLTNTFNNDTRTATTNSSGWLGGLAPKNAILQLEVIPATPFCTLANAPIYTQTITTSSIDVKLGTINVTLPNTALVSGTIWDCANNGVANGTVLLQPGNYLVNANKQGQFFMALPCVPAQPITMQPYDNNTFTKGSTSNPIAIQAGNNLFGTYLACGNTSHFLTLSMTNTFINKTTNYTFLEPIANINCTVNATPNSLILATEGVAPSVVKSVGFNVNDTTTNTATMNAFSVNGISNPTWTDISFTMSTGTTNTVTYTSFPNAPNDVLGTYSATLIGYPSGNAYTVKGSFRAKR
jgi:hypothetical protein